MGGLGGTRVATDIKAAPGTKYYLPVLRVCMTFDWGVTNAEKLRDAATAFFVVLAASAAAVK